ncbi:GNAT family N-acetyltransferase [Anaerosacchariphilus polymeriproducens]|uniref:GNAT family N-acetyltransferase n=1 Tax=Anaerosacchariphilus polymeriproducens TaxID=1812858 RepID=A0A371AUQ2_9FIRM|nr:GNAT family N-acetyltransferase [Anaerosacchariphilus polymeriproducens]RDU23220.1 GNAT family N-acetyltransferase [Anaerosacchariphilus polymeriproducens]
MSIKFKKSIVEEAEELVRIYNEAFYADYVRFGVCPGYGHTVENMRQSISRNLKYTIFADKQPVGAISAVKESEEVYHIGCLCIIPEYQGLGIGFKAIQFLKETLPDWKELVLDTPVDKIENVGFYTHKCGFEIIEEYQEGKIKLYKFRLKRIK